MKLTTIFFLSLFLLDAISGLSQSLKELDKLNGFRQFKFGMTPREISSISPSKNNLNLKNVTCYDFSDPSMSSFGSADITTISLSFYKNRLYRIMVFFGSQKRPFNSDQFNVIKDIFCNTFGKNYQLLSDVEGVNVLGGMTWISDFVRLDFLRLAYKSQISGYALFYHLEMDRLQQKDELN